MYGDADAAIARVEEDVRRAQQRAEKLPLLREAVDAARGTAVSRERDLGVTVNLSGRIVALTIDDSALARGGTRLAADLVRLLGQAHQDLQRQVLGSAIEALGDDDPIVDTYRSSIETTEDTPRNTGGLW